MPSMPFDVEAAQYVSLATFRKSGVEVRTPVWIAGKGARHYVFSEATAGKVKRIRANGRAKLARCDVRGKVSSGWVDARARIVRDTAEIGEAYALLHAKYGWRIAIADFFSKLTGRYDRRAMLAIELAAEPLQPETHGIG
jgi:uncharacterized protein